MSNRVPLTKLEQIERNRKLRRYAMIAGVLLALVCKSLPHDYQQACGLIVKACQGTL